MPNKAAKVIKISRLAGTKQLLATASGDAILGNTTDVNAANVASQPHNAQSTAVDIDGNNSNTGSRPEARPEQGLKGTMIFITHALPHNLRVDAVIQIGKHGAKEMQVVKAAAGAGGGA